jgi:hypothetical protein
MESTMIHRTEKGQIFLCNRCDKYHFEYGNVVLAFSEEHLREFADWVLALDGEHWEEACSDTVYRRKIHVPISGCHLRFALTLEELDEVKKLLWRAVIRNRLGEPLDRKVVFVN